MEKLKELLDNGEGHTIFKTDHVIKALEKAGFKVQKSKLCLDFQKDNKGYVIPLTLKPTKPAKSKYDVAEWNMDSPDGVHDLNLIRSICIWLAAVKNEKCDAGDYMGRGFQYRSYREWLKERGI